MQRIGKTVVVWAAVLLTAVDPASACRWRCGGWFPRRCCNYAPPCVPCETVVTCGDGCSSCVETEVVTSPGPTLASPQPSQSGPTEIRPIPQTPQPAPEVLQPRQPAAPPLPADTTPKLQPLEEMPDATPPALPTEEMPEQPAKPAQPSDDVEDLFKDSDSGEKKAAAQSPASVTPAETEKKGDDVEDLFKDSDDKKTSTNRHAAPEVAQVATQSELEALFTGPAAAPKKTGVRPAQTVKHEEPKTLAPPAAAPVSQPATRQVEVVPAPLVSAPAETPDAMRIWTDNTGNYQVNARLVVVGDAAVRLLKDTGKYTTVPFSRLSASDLEFVRRLSMTSVAGKF